MAEAGTTATPARHPAEPGPSTRSRRRSGFAVAVIALLACPLATAAGPAGTPTGDPGAIALYKQVIAAYRAVPAVIMTVRGNFWYTTSGNGFGFYDGAVHPANAKAATQSILVLLASGQVTKMVVTAKAPGLATLTIIQDSSGTWAALQNRPAACFYRQPAQSIGANYGKALFSLFGRFAPLRQRGAETLVTSTFPWGRSGTATELDTVARANDTVLSSRYTVPGPQAHVFTIAYRILRRPPGFVLAPEPHC